MMLLTNTTAQTLAVGDSIIFDRVLLNTGSCECHRRNGSSVKLCSKGIYEISFSCNVNGTGVDGDSLAIQVSGETLPETEMDIVTAGTTSLINLSTDTAYKVCCCDYTRIQVTNTGTGAVVVQPNSALLIKRIS